MAKRLTKEEYIQKAKKTHGDKYDYSETYFKTIHNLATFICPVHGKFQQRAYSHFVSGCLKCSHITPVDKEKFIEVAKSKHGDKYDYSKVNFVNKNTPVLIGCPVHSYFNQSPKVHMRGHGCQPCSVVSSIGKRTHTTDIFTQKAIKVHGDKYNYDKTIYTSDKEKLVITCKEHGDFSQQASSHLQGRGCPRCRYIYQKDGFLRQYVSKGENKLIEILDDLKIEYEYQYRIPGFRYKYDFYLPKHNLIIEYDGKQHFCEHSWGGKEALLFNQQRDRDKDNLANEKDYNLLRIDYRDFNKIAKLLKRKLSKISRIKPMKEENATNLNNKLLVAYVDGSTRLNPGYSGYGIFGYTLVPSKRPSKINHPVKTKLRFTSSGIVEEKDSEPYETVDIVEHIGCLNTPTGTNNLAEMTGFIVTLKLAINLGITHLKVHTDSNYVVLNFTEHLQKWKDRDWKRADGSPVAHRSEWEAIDSLHKELTALNCKVEAIWVKGHAGDYGNEMADLYSVIGSNYSRIQFEENSEVFTSVAYSNVSSYKDYKDSLAEKDIIYYFRDLFFSSASINDTNYCFLSSSDNINEQGRRDTSSIFLTNVGYVPDLINQVKNLYRRVPRVYVANCCLKLSKLEDRELSRLTRLVGIEKLLRPVTHNGITSLHLIKDHTPFVTEFNQEFPYITEVSRIFNNSLDISVIPNNPLIKEVDVTDVFLKEGKIAFANTDKDIDLTERVTNANSSSDYFKGLTFTNKLLATVGKDFPNYIALKSIEANIQKVTAIVELRQDSSMATLYIAIHTADRLLCTVNITNKFLVRRT